MIFSLITLFSSNARKKERERDEREKERTGGFSSILVKDDRPTSECQANCLQYGPETQSTSIYKWHLFPPEKVQRCSKQARANNQVVTETTETGSWAQVMASVLIKVFWNLERIKNYPRKETDLLKPVRVQLTFPFSPPHACWHHPLVLPWWLRGTGRCHRWPEEISPHGNVA